MRIGLAAVLVFMTLALARAASAQEFEPPKSEPRTSSIPDPGVVPSFGVMQAHVFSRQLDETVGYTAAIPVYLGATFHPMPSRVSPISNVGVEMTWLPGSGHVEWTPIGRFGVAILVRDDEGKGDDLVRKMFPAFETYLIAGYRIPGEARGGAGRIGVGIASPILMPLSLTGSGCFPAPSSLEATMDVSDTRGGPRDYQIRLGWFF